jgi:hypothetical protein
MEAANKQSTTGYFTMKNRILQTLTVAAVVFTAMQSAANADWFFIFKAVAMMPVQQEATDSKGNDIIIKKTLGSNDLVNLALGRSLSTKPNPDTEILALAHNSTTPSTSKLIVYNKNTQQIVATICKTTSLPGIQQTDKLNTEKEKGDGIAVVSFQATTLGTPAKNGVTSATTAYGAATGSWTPTPTGPVFALKATALIGPMKFRVTDASNVTTNFDGLVVNGMFQTTGVAIDKWLNWVP